MITRIFCLIFFILLHLVSSAQFFSGNDADKKVPGASEVRINESTRSISFIRLNEKNSMPANDAAGWLKSVLHARPEDDVRLYHTEQDKIGFTHFRYRQYYQNIPVEYSMYIVHVRDGKIISANGEYYPGISVSLQPSVNPGEALQIAKNDVHAKTYKSGSSVESLPELVIIRVDDGTYRLAYKADVYAEEPLSRNWIYVDASDGRILKKVNRIETVDVNATAVTHYSGTKGIRTDSLSATSFRLRENARGTGNGTITRNLLHGSSYGSATDFTNTTNNWPLAFDNAALDAHYGAEKTYDHYYNNYGWNSFNGFGGTILSYVHYSTGYVNAFWDGTEMTYGDGDGVQYSPLTSLEIVGHEITHGVTENSANLTYSGESGALNESFSDIMGNTIRFIYDPSLATWFVGDQIVISGGGATPFRNMANPNDFNCPDTYGGLYWNNGDIVHYNSGVQNFWYYLLSTGGTGVNDIGNSYTVNGIGLTDANAIAFRNLTNYLTPGSTFADARTYSIQAAIDLFGNCSNQVVQTSNAWYAVGVGGLFSNAVVASFTAAQNYFCTTPATVNFSNNSINATGYTWDFGDGNTSTAMNPSHTYASPGVFTVTLIATGAATCGNNDTLIVPGYVTVTNTGGPIPASCLPATTAYCCNIGITNVQLNTINNTSPAASEGYRDFTCANATTLTAGDPYTLNVTTGVTYNENVMAWIDYNNDGQFNNTTELVFTSLHIPGSHAGVIHTPASATLGTPLRMRVIDDYENNTITSSCYNPQYGQAEDYTVNFVANTLPPVAGFIASDTTINVGGTVYFSDLSSHGATSWNWTFSGGAPVTSVLQNPAIVYSVLGDYTVTLHVSNSFGADSITKTMYIHVVNSINMCSATSTAAPFGQFYDSGGPSGGYQNNENCSLLIAPACATSVTLIFSFFQTEYYYDYLYVYNGPNASAPLLLTAYGSTLPATVTANSGQMFIVFQSNSSATYAGFAAAWTSVIVSSLPPVADFSVNDTTPPINTALQFSDQSSNSPVAWMWNFGDGGSSTLQNPTHAFTTSGVHTITLIAFTCNQSDTISKTVTVQSPPSVFINPDTLNASVACGSTVTVNLTVYNSGSGDLVYSTSGNNAGPVKILSFTYGSDTTEEYPHTLTAINQYFTNYTLTRYSGTNASQLQAALSGKDVLLFPEQENSLTTVYTPLASVVQNFVNSGGVIVVCGSYTGYANRIFDLGLFSGSYAGANPSGLTTLDTTDAITNNVPLSFAPPNATFYMNFTNSDKVKLVQVTGTGNDVVSYRHIGSGTVIYIGFDYYLYNNATAQLAANSVSYRNSSLVPWIQTSPSSDTVTAGGSSVIQVTFSTTGLFAGVHTTNLILTTNDPLHPTVIIPCTLTVSGSPSIALSKSCLNFGTVMQYTTTPDTLYIRNNGCDTLRVTSLSPSLPAYTVTPSGNLHIAPYDSAMIVVHFSSATTGTFNGNLVIHDNDRDTVVCLIAAVTPAPVISTVPDSFHVTISSCNDSITLPLMIYNTGGTNLTYSINGTGQGSPTDTSVLVIQETSAWGLYMSGFIQARYGITPTVITSSQIAATDFSLYNVIFTVGDESVTYYTNLSNNVTKFRNFVSSGGIIQYQMAMQGTDTVNLAGGARMIYGNMQNQNTGLLLSHPILNGVTNPLTGNYANHSYLDHLPSGTSVISETGTLSLPTTVEYNYGSGTVIATGMTWEWLYQNSNNAGLMLPNATSYAFSKIHQGVPWITLSSTVDTILPGDSSLVYVTFISSGLSNGTYTTSLVIHSNDPLVPLDTIPCTLTVSGTPSIALSQSCLNFGSVMQYTTQSDTFYIRNPGCDTLQVTGLIPSLAGYSAVPSNNVHVPPHDSTMIIVHFSSSVTGTFNGNLVIHDNDADTVVCLTATVVTAPVISTAPTSFDIYLDACNDSVTRPLKIFNAGGSNLVYAINGGGNGIVGDTSVLVIQETTSWGVDMNSFLQTHYGITPTVIFSSQIPTTDFMLYDIIITVGAQSNAYYANLSNNLSKFEAFITAGGIVQYQMGTYTGTPNVTLAGSAVMVNGNYQNQNIGLLPAHPILNGIANPINESQANLCYITNMPAGAQVITETSTLSLPTTIEYQMGNGRVIATGMPWEYRYYNNNPSGPMLPNSISYIFSKISSAAGWVSLSSTSGTVIPGDSVMLAIVFHSAGLQGGVYTTSVVIHSNDPLLPNDTIPCTLHVASNPCADFNFTAGNCSSTVGFNSNPINAPTSYYWTFGDGGSDTAANPFHTYAGAGTYSVQLIVCNAFG
ncbi:MAG: PKD domain-containing protein, partial [Bacteroidetes bacterium]|nr:PKD domain-containing protein [Bacteroidota bacterium]